MSNANRNIITRAEFRDFILELAEEENKKHEDEYIKVPIDVAERRIKDWTTLYRRNMDIFVEDYLGIKLAPFQKIMLTQMAENDIQVNVCSRGLSKSFVTGLFAIAYALLYPSVKILITARTLGQANLIIDEKIDKIFCSENTPWSSPILCQMRHDGYISFSTDKESGGREVRVGFENTNESVIYARGALESTRGIRSNIIITDEYVLVKKKDYTEIVRPTLEPRRFKCRQNFPDYDEETKEILLSSAKTKTNWGWGYLKDIVQRHFKGENVGFYAGDIYTAVINGIKTKKQFEKDKKSTDDISFMQEYLNIWLGNSEKSLYKYEDFEANQILQNAFIPLSDYDFMMGEENEYRPKDNEVRILAMDVAIATGQSNDNTAIILGNINKDTLLASVEYVNGVNGLGTDEQCLLVKRLFYEYNAHYFVFDSKGLGNSFYSALNKETFDPQRNVTYPAWRIHEDSMLMMCTQSALNEKMSMATNDGEDVIIPVVGSASLNTLMHLALRKSLKDSVIKFLIDDGDASAYFEEQKYKDKWMLMTADERADKMLPYLNTKFMINEAVSLEADMKDDGNIKVIETRTGYKDRFMALDYFNYFTTLLRTKWFNETDDDNIDVSEWELVF